jgi:uncharacterized OB-fold protein
MTGTSSIDVAPSGGRLIDETLFHGAGGEIALAGSRCVACGAMTFPVQRSCPRCAGDDVESVPLPRTGTLWGFTVQAFPPKTPYLLADERPFAPYAVGYVDLDHRVLVETRIVTDDPASLAVGDEMTLVLEQLRRDESGPVLTYAFAPVGARRASRGSDAENTQDDAP